MACTGFVYAGLTNTMPKLFEMGLGPELAVSYTEIGLFRRHHFRHRFRPAASSAAGLPTGSRRAPSTSCSGGCRCRCCSSITSMADLPLLVVALLVLSFNLSYSAAENMLIAHYTPIRWRAFAFGARFVLALGAAGVTVILAGWIFDTRGSFEVLVRVVSASRRSALPRPACCCRVGGARPRFAPAAARRLTPRLRAQGPTSETFTQRPLGVRAHATHRPGRWTSAPKPEVGIARLAGPRSPRGTPGPRSP